MSHGDSKMRARTETQEFADSCLPLHLTSLGTEPLEETKPRTLIDDLTVHFRPENNNKTEKKNGFLYNHT